MKRDLFGKDKVLTKVMTTGTSGEITAGSNFRQNNVKLKE